MAHSGDEVGVGVPLGVKDVADLALQRDVGLSEFGHFVVELGAHESAYINKRINIALNKFAALADEQLDAVLVVQPNVVNVFRLYLVDHFVKNFLLLVYALHLQLLFLFVYHLYLFCSFYFLFQLEEPLEVLPSVRNYLNLLLVLIYYLPRGVVHVCLRVIVSILFILIALLPLSQLRDARLSRRDLVQGLLVCSRG